MVFFHLGLLVLSSAVNGLNFYDICSKEEPKKIFVSMGERGVITVEDPDWETQRECRIGLITCPTCVIFVRLRNVGGEVCNRTTSNQTEWADRMELGLSEGTYSPRTEYCLTAAPHTPLTYRSLTRTVNIHITYSPPLLQELTIEYISERNRQYYKGKPGSNNVTFGGYIKSPFFPAVYPKDLGAEYVISCQHSDLLCRIRLIFTDFIVPQQSIIEFYDWTGERIKVNSGAKPRPPVIITTGPSLLVRFFGNGASSIGYKAAFYFLIGDVDEENISPITDCGGEVENYGGAITMMDMAAGTKHKSYDCVWLIRPLPEYTQANLFLYVSVASFQAMVGESTLQVHSGETSEGRLLETVKSPAPRPRPQHIRPVHTGFYVSLKATLNSSSRLAIAYTVFSNLDCFGGGEFLCQNRRCIAVPLHCDGFDHCGDNSDEPDTCSQDWKLEPVDRRWYNHIPNFYFPKVDRYADLKTATLVFVLSSIGLVCLIAALVLLLYRMGLRARQQRELQSRLQTITDFLEGNNVEEEIISDDPPIYEPPPEYSQVVKKFKNHKLKKNVICSLNTELRCDKSTSTTPDSPPPAYCDLSPKSLIKKVLIGEGGSSKHENRTSCEAGPSRESKFSLDLSRLLTLMGGRSAEAGHSRARSGSLTHHPATWSPASSVQLLKDKPHSKPHIKMSNSTGNLLYYH